MLWCCPPPSIKVAFRDSEWILHRVAKMGGAGGGEGREAKVDASGVKVFFVRANYRTVARL